MLETIAENLIAAIVLTLGIPTLGYVIKNYISWKFKERELKLLNTSKREDALLAGLHQELLLRKEELVLLIRDETEDMGIRICAYYEYRYLKFNGPTLKYFKKILEALEDAAPIAAAREIMKEEYPILFSKYKDIIKDLTPPASPASEI